jgi:hypothetical protein
MTVQPNPLRTAADPDDTTFGAEKPELKPGPVGPGR